MLIVKQIDKKGNGCNGYTNDGRVKLFPQQL